MEQIAEGLDGVRVYVDDLVVCRSTQMEHDERLEKTMQRIRPCGLKLNKDKSLFSVNEIKFLRDKISAEGIQPDEEKVQAKQDMERPMDRKGVQRALGMVSVHDNIVTLVFLLFWGGVARIGGPMCSVVRVHDEFLKHRTLKQK